MSVNSAYLEVRLESARDLKDTETFGTQDPYVVLQVGNSSARSKTHTDGGRCPVWRETLRFNHIIHEAEILLTIRNENVLSKDDVIGTARVPLAQVKAAGTQTVHAPVVTSGGKQRGTITLVLTYRPAAAAAHPAGAPAAPPTHAFSAPAPAPMPYPGAPYGAPPPQQAAQPYYNNGTYPAPGGAPAAAAYPTGQPAYGPPAAAYGVPPYSQAPAAVPAGAGYPPMYGGQPPATAGYPAVQSGYPSDPYGQMQQQQMQQQQQQQQQPMYGGYPGQAAGAYGQAPAPAPGAYYGAPQGAAPYPAPAGQPYPAQAYPTTGYY